MNLKSTLMILIIIAWSIACQAHQLEIEGVWNSMHSDHANNCNPNCANQNNGGLGLIIRYKSDTKHLDLAVGRIYLINSYGDKGRVDFLQLDRAEYSNRFLRASIAIWLMTIYGYKNDDGSAKIENLPPWPKFQLGINPLWFLTDNVYINYNMIYFPLVKIDWLSASYIAKF